ISQDAAQVPSAYCAGHRTTARQEPFARSKRQLVVEGSREYVRLPGGRYGLVEMAIVLVARPAGPAWIVPRRRKQRIVRVARRLRPGVGHKQVQPLGHALLQFGLQRMVEGIAVV